MKKYIVLITIVSIIAVSCNSDPLITNEDILNVPLGSFWGPTYLYSVNISFEDSSGNDLVATLAKEDCQGKTWDGRILPNKDSYLLDFSFSYPDAFPHDIPGIVVYDHPSPNHELTICKYNYEYQIVRDSTGYGRYCLNHHCGYLKTGGLDIALATFIDDYIKDNPIQDSIVYKLTCPKIFGDNKVHNLVTYWEDDPFFRSDTPKALEQFYLYPHCYKALFDGKEVLVNAVPRQTNREYYDYYIDIVLDK